MQNVVTERFILALEHLQEQGMVNSVRQFALKIEAHPQSIHAIMKGKRDATVEMITQMVSLFNVNTNYLLRGYGDMIVAPRNEDKVDNITYVPYAAHAGYADQFIDAQGYDESVKFSVPGYSDRGEHRCFDVKGDSMDPTLFHEDKIVCSKVARDNYYTSLRNGYVYVIITSQEILVKRVENRLRTDGVLVLKSDNSHYDPISISGNDIKEVWKVNMKISHFMPDPKHVRNSLHQEVNRLQDVIDSQQSSLDKMQRSLDTLLRRSGK